MKVLKLIGAALAGAITLYFLDPLLGKHRRKMAGDQATHLANDAGVMVHNTREDIKNRAAGLVHETKQRIKNEPVDDRTLEARVRADLGHHTERIDTLLVSAENGVVTLRGPIDEDEVDGLMAAAKAVIGVQDVLNRMDIYESAK